MQPPQSLHRVRTASDTPPLTTVSWMISVRLTEIGGMTLVGEGRRGQFGSATWMIMKTVQTGMCAHMNASAGWLQVQSAACPTREAARSAGVCRRPPKPTRKPAEVLSIPETDLGQKVGPTKGMALDTACAVRCGACRGILESIHSELHARERHTTMTCSNTPPLSRAKSVSHQTYAKTRTGPASKANRCCKMLRWYSASFWNCPLHAVRQDCQVRPSVRLPVPGSIPAFIYLHLSAHHPRTQEEPSVQSEGGDCAQCRGCGRFSVRAVSEVCRMCSAGSVLRCAQWAAGFVYKRGGGSFWL